MEKLGYTLFIKVVANLFKSKRTHHNLNHFINFARRFKNC